MKLRKRGVGGVVVVAACLAFAGLVGHCRAQANASGLSPRIQEIVKLSKARLTDDVILAYIKNSGVSYRLTANDVVYLSAQGVSQPVLAALLQAKAAALPQAAAPDIAPPSVAAPMRPPSVAAPVIPKTSPPPATVPTSKSTRDELAPYGTWIEIPGYGSCWRPAEVMTDLSWRPYCNRGRWLYTEYGWFWQSEYPWGDLVFHHGRWFKHASLGWVWQPAYDWAPAWVSWRHAEGYCGWAPLPPQARFEAGVGLTFNGHVGADFDFGLGEDAFVFVPYDHFWDSNLRGFLLPRNRLGIVFRASRSYNNYRMINGRFFNEGIGRERIGLYTHREIRVERPVSRWYPR